MENSVYNNLTKNISFNNKSIDDNNEQNKGETSRQTFNQYMAAKRQKLVDQFKEEVNRFQNRNNKTDNNTIDNKNLEINRDLSKLFSGVCIYVNGYTKPSALILKQLMAEYGGIYLNHFDATRTTHTIATNLPFSKTKKLKGNERIVFPEWIVDSIKHQKLLPIHQYLVVKTGGDIDRFLDRTKSNHTINSSDYIEQNYDNIEIEGQLVDNWEELFVNGDENQDNCLDNSVESINKPIDNPIVNPIVDPVFVNNVNHESNCVSVNPKTTTCEKVLVNNSNDSNSDSNKFVESDFVPNTVSQIDQEFLYSLPLNLRQEIITSVSNSNKLPKVCVSEKLTKKLVNNNKKIKKKLKNSPKKLKKSPKKLIKNNKTFGKPVKSGPLDKIFKEIKSCKRGGILTSNINANICGKTNPKDVIPLIKEWVETEEDLIDEDIAYVTKYFMDLINERKYDHIKQITVAFYESIDVRNNVIWKESYNDIINVITNELKQNNCQSKVEDNCLRKFSII